MNLDIITVDVLCDQQNYPRPQGENRRQRYPRNQGGQQQVHRGPQEYFVPQGGYQFDRDGHLVDQQGNRVDQEEYRGQRRNQRGRRQDQARNQRPPNDHYRYRRQSQQKRKLHRK